MQSISAGEFGVIGGDSDDQLRLIQIRDYYLHGQNWFDTQQYRLGIAGGTDIHWSRLVDIPFIFLIAFFDLFLSYELAEAIAISVWPPLSAIVVMLGIYIAARNLAGRKAGFIAAIISALFITFHYRFSVGAIDHHNVQIGLLCLSMGFALDPEYDSRAFLLSGIFVGLSAAIGNEVYLFVGIICGFIALLWLFKSRKCRAAVQAFGIGFALTIAFTFFAAISPREYSLIYCDALSLITVSAAGLGGLGLALLANRFSASSIKFRFGLLILLGLGTLLLLKLQAPECLQNPLDVLPEKVRTYWLANITEAKPLLQEPKSYYLEAPFFLGGSLVALTVCIFQILKRNAYKFALPAALILVAILMALYQVRFAIFAQFFAFSILGIWIYLLYNNREKSGKTNIAYIGALALSIPIFWTIPGIMFAPAQDKNDLKSVGKICYSDEVLQAVKSMPKGKILAGYNAAPHILLKTDHSVLSGNYHRNAKGLLSAIEIFSANEPQASNRLATQNIRYIMTCDAEANDKFSDGNPEGLLAKLLKGDIPPYLSQDLSLKAGAVKIYRIIPEKIDPSE
ncbi:MAG: hypothetical protein HKN36_03510 [Hellea sp.]|nr:hypothetical protein [Hellea sp.]